MRKYIVLTLLLCVHLFTQAQLTYRYWFDVDEATMQEGVSATNEWQMDIDVSSLAECIHQLHVQVMDKTNTWSAPVTHWFVKTLTIACHGEYWFDDQDGNRHRVDVENGHFDIDVNALTDGIHMLTYQLCDANDSPLAQYRALFQKSPTPTNANVHYWVDEETDKMQTLAYNGELHVLDLSDVSDGLHLLHIQAEDSSPSSTLAKMFIKIPQTEGVDELCCICTVDGELVKQENVVNSDGVLNWLLDVSEIPLGFHHIMVQVITKNGAGSSMYEGYFLRDFSAAEMASLQCIYSIDGGEHKTMAGNMGSGVFHFDLDVADIEDGLHNIIYMLIGEGGVGTKSNSALFWKTPIGGNGVTQYCYWLNDMTEKHEVKLAQRTNPYNLVTLLPVEQMPIRSSCFMFRVNDGVPTLYAKNDIHFEFTDASGFTSTANAQYVDESVSEVVNDLSELQLTQTFVRPSENEVKWFKFEAEEGDSVIFKASQATTIQVFAPSGKEVYSVSGDKSIIFGGTHTMDGGTYYVAVHDVMGTKPDVILDTKHIDKYDIFEFTPERMSGVGKTCMYFKGNGLNYVESIELCHGDVRLSPDTIVATSSDMIARFSMIEELSSPKQFTMNLFFHDVVKGERKTLTFENAVILEPVNKGNIEVSIVTESRVGDPYPIKVTIKNTGNISNFGLPLNIAYDNVAKIDEFDFINFDLLLSDELYESRDFFTYTDNLVGTGKEGLFLPLLIPYIGPYEEETLVFGVKTKFAHTIFNFYAWTGDAWYAPRAVYSDNHMDGPYKASSARDDCDEPNTPSPNDTNPNLPNDGYDPSERPDEPYDPDLLYGPANLADVMSNLPIGPGQVVRPFLGAGEAIGGLIQGGTRSREDAILGNCGLDPSDPANDQFRFHYQRPVFRSPREIWGDANPFQASGRRSSMVKAAASSEGRSLEDIASSDCPDPTPHPTNIYIPGDPNEMTGYVSAAGSHFMTDSINNISFDIEFENDPEIANSSAHVIVIENEIDANRFNLDSFTPRDITLSGKKIELNGEQSFVKTIDLRPSINAIAELRCEYDNRTGIARWTLSSLDPMTMETTDDIMQGILPVNYDGTSGMGNVTYSIDLKEKFPDGTKIANKASIIFDNNEAIETPVWTNIVDAVAPTSMVSDLIVRNDSIYDLRFEGEDNRSGIWKYTLYVQDGLSAPWREVATDIAPDSTYSFKGFDCINYGFCVLATDSAGNVERKELTAEVVKMTMHLGDVNADGDINVIDFTAIANHIMGSTPASFVVEAADVNEDDEINVMDLTGVANLILFGEVSPNRAQATSRLRRVSDLLTLHVSDCEVTAGEEFTVDIRMDGDAVFSAFQFDMALPEGIHVKMVDGAPCATLSTERTNTADTDFFVSRLSDDGTLRVFSASTRNVGFEGNEGCVAHVTLIADEKAPAGDYEVAVSHIVAAYGGTGENLSPANFVTTVGGSTDMNSLIDGTHGSSLYDMVGKKIRKDHERTGLEKGAYINNGKKVIVK